MVFDETDKSEEVKDSNLDEKVLLTTSKMDDYDKQKEEWRSDGKISSNYNKNLQGQIIAEDIANSLSLRFGHRTSITNIKSINIRFWFGISESVMAKKTEVELVNFFLNIGFLTFFNHLIYRFFLKCQMQLILIPPR